MWGWGWGWEVAAAAVSFTLCPSDTQIPARPSPREPGSLNLGSWPEARSRRLPDGESTSRFGQLPTAESPKCRWRLARAGAELRGTPPLGAEGVNGLVGGGRLVRRASISPAEGASPPLRLLRALPAREALGDAGQINSPALCGARGGFASRRLTSARPCRALLLLQPAGGFVRPRPLRPPPPACPHLAFFIESAAAGLAAPWDPRVLGKERASRGAGELRGGVGVGREREREQVRASCSRASARQQLGPPFGKIIGT